MYKAKSDVADMHERKSSSADLGGKIKRIGAVNQKVSQRHKILSNSVRSKNWLNFLCVDFIFINRTKKDEWTS